MAVIYVDFDTANGNDSDDGSTWALAKLTLQAGITAAGDGGTVYVRRTNAGRPGSDTAAAARTLTAGAVANMPQIIGCKDGTTAEPPTSADLAIEGTDTQPLYECTSGGNDITLAGSATVISMKFSGVDRIRINTLNTKWEFIGCHVAHAGFLYATTGNMVFTDCNIESTGTAAVYINLATDDLDSIQMYGCRTTFTAAPSSGMFYPSGQKSRFIFIGHDFSGLGNKILMPLHSSSGKGHASFVNCSVPATYTAISGTPTINAWCEMVNCTSDTTIDATATIRDYLRVDWYGQVEMEETVVRTGGADDGTTDGLFSYIMTPHVNKCNDGTSEAVKSPWMNVWVPGGANTLKVYTVHDNDVEGAGAINRDLYEDELWCEFYTPDVGDTAQHDHTLDPAGERFFGASTTATGTADTTSFWATYNTYKRYFTVALTQGYEGWAYARVHYAKRFSANQIAVYVDPLIEVT